MDTQTIIAYLEKKTVKPTVNRILIYSTLHNIGHPVSLRDMEISMPNLDKSSIFRVLTLFAEQHIVHAFEDGRGILQYELCRHHDTEPHTNGHVHFYCKVCQKTFCIEESTIPTMPLPEGFIPHSTSFIIKGICPNCAKKKIK